MIPETTLLVVITSIKILAILLMASYLFGNWRNQKIRFKSDLPYLMAITFFIYGFMKILDIYLYLYVIQNGTPTEGFALVVGRYMRFIFSPVLTMGILTYILIKIWFPEKRKLQIFIGLLWISGALLALILIKELNEFYVAIGIFTAPILLFTIATFFIAHSLKKLPNVNSLALAIGYTILMTSQLLRNFWREMGEGPFGYSWIGELIELFSLMIIAYGFSHNATYAKPNKLEEKELTDIEKNEFGSDISNELNQELKTTEDWEEIDLLNE